MIKLFIYSSKRPPPSVHCLSVRSPANRALNVTVNSTCLGKKWVCSDLKQPALRPAGPNKISGNVRRCRRYTDRRSYQNWQLEL